MVIARIEPEWLMGWSVKVGAVFPLTQICIGEGIGGVPAREPALGLAEIIAAQDRIRGKKALAALDRISPREGIFRTTTAIPAFSPIAVRSSNHRGARWRP